MGDARRRHGYLRGAAMQAMAGAAALLVGTALMGSAALAGGEPPTTEPPTTEPPTTLAPEDPPVQAGDPPAQVGDPPAQVAAITSFTKVFDPVAIAPGGTSKLTFTIDVDADTTGLAFTDNLAAAGLEVASPPNASTSCTDPGGATYAPTAGSTSITFAGWDLLAADLPCTVEVDVTSTTPGDHVNTTPALTSDIPDETRPSGPDVTLTVTPGFTKAFLPASVAIAGVSTLTYTINNIGNTAAVTDLAFTDNLPTGLTVAPTPNATTTCTPGGTVTATAGSATISLAAGTVSADTSCTVSVSVTASTAGTYTSTSGPLSSSLGTGGTATATLTVAAAIATAVTTPSASGPGLAATGVSTTTLLTAIGTIILLIGALLVYGSQRRRLAQH